MASETGGFGFDRAGWTQTSSGPGPRRNSASSGPCFRRWAAWRRRINLEAFLAPKLLRATCRRGPGLERRFPIDVISKYAARRGFVAGLCHCRRFLFPSFTDTFGNVVLEALASGIPVAAFPVTGHEEVIGNMDAGVLDFNFGGQRLGHSDFPRGGAGACPAL
jgi:hypothetical protein